MACTATPADRYRASMVLSATCDAVGYRNGTFEFCGSGKIIHEQWDELTHGKSTAGFVIDLGWRVSDDTVMAIATGEGMLDAHAHRSGKAGRGGGGSPTLEAECKAVAAKYKACWRDMTGRAPGKATGRALTKWVQADGSGWNSSPFNDTNCGCGAAMRSAPIGLVYASQAARPRLVACSVECGRITHHHPTGYLGSLTTALFTALALRSVPAELWPAVLLEEGLPAARAYVSADTRRDPQRNVAAFSAFTSAWEGYLNLRGLPKTTIPFLSYLPRAHQPAHRQESFLAPPTTLREVFSSQSKGASNSSLLGCNLAPKKKGITKSASANKIPTPTANKSADTKRVRRSAGTLPPRRRTPSKGASSPIADAGFPKRKAAKKPAAAKTHPKAIKAAATAEKEIENNKATADASTEVEDAKKVRRPRAPGESEETKEAKEVRVAMHEALEDALKEPKEAKEPGTDEGFAPSTQEEDDSDVVEEALPPASEPEDDPTTVTVTAAAGSVIVTTLSTADGNGVVSLPEIDLDFVIPGHRTKGASLAADDVQRLVLATTPLVTPSCTMDMIATTAQTLTPTPPLPNAWWPPDFDDPVVRDRFYTSLSHNGKGGASGHDSVIIAYDAVLGSRGSWEQLVRRAALHGGDNDSTGAIAGAWWGARYGFANVPPTNWEMLEYRQRLVKLAEALFKMKS
eukprot:TRINITY_DN7115_c0_g1_i1.p1 TRINITY_DN7115_c0_g1~~TRINITY_DN7115_c0_g1_i1.p1  ORF type:complete len:687 (+),score=170.15 TRINITY_DN7115_c0_g1_i1:37-2097(+)